MRLSLKGLRGLAVSAALVPALLAPAPASAAPVPDFSCGAAAWPYMTELGTGGPGLTNEVAATFKVGLGGYLSRARLSVKNETAGGTWYVRIRPLDASLVPQNTVMAEAVFADPLPQSSGFQDLIVDFPSPPAVLASGRYALTLQRSGGSGIHWEALAEDYPNGPPPCPDSRTWIRPPTGTTFAPNFPPRETVDLVFTTYLSDVSGPVTCAGGAIPVNGLCPASPQTKPKPPKKKKKKKKKKKRKKGK